MLRSAAVVGPLRPCPVSSHRLAVGHHAEVAGGRWGHPPRRTAVASVGLWVPPCMAPVHSRSADRGTVREFPFCFMRSNVA